MSSENNCIARFEPLRVIDSGDLEATYVQVGPVIQNPIREITIKNNTNGIVYISFNGVDDHIAYPPTSGDAYDLAANRVDPAGRLEQPAQGFIWARYEGAAPTTGAVYVMLLYASPF